MQVVLRTDHTRSVQHHSRLGDEQHVYSKGKLGSPVHCGTRARAIRRCCRHMRRLRWISSETRQCAQRTRAGPSQRSSSRLAAASASSLYVRHCARVSCRPRSSCRDAHRALNCALSLLTTADRSQHQRMRCVAAPLPCTHCRDGRHDWRRELAAKCEQSTNSISLGSCSNHRLGPILCPYSSVTAVLRCDCGAVRFGAVRCGAVRCGAVRCASQPTCVSNRDWLAQVVHSAAQWFPQWLAWHSAAAMSLPLPAD